MNSTSLHGARLSDSARPAPRPNLPGESNVFAGYSARGTNRLGRARLWLQAFEQLEHLLAPERLLLQQCGRHAIERCTVLRQQPDGVGEGAIGQPRLLLVAQALRLLRE